MSDFELKWEIYELPESSRVFWVTGTRIQKFYGLLPNPKEGIYKTRNEAKRAVARYRKESVEYLYSHPGSIFKNTSKAIRYAIDEALKNTKLEFEKAKDGRQTIKVARIKIDGLSDYKPTKVKDKE